MKVTRELKVHIELDEEEAWNLAISVSRMLNVLENYDDLESLVNDRTIDRVLGFRVAIGNALESGR